ILALDIVDDGRARPCQQRGNHKTNALPRAGGCKTEHMFRTVVPEVTAIKSAEHNAVWSKKPSAPNLARIRPTRRAICRHMPSFPRPPDRKDNGNDDGCDAAACGDAGPLNEDEGRVRIEFEPPDEEGKWLIDRPAQHDEPGRTELRLVSQTPGGPLRRSPEKTEHDNRNEEQLTPEDTRRGHGRGSARLQMQAQRQFFGRRNVAQHSAEIGGSERELSLAAKIPVHAPGT